MMNQLRRRWQRIPARARLGVLIAALAVAGLIWQHHSAPEPAQPRAGHTPAVEATGDGHDHGGHDHQEAGGHAVGEFQPDPTDLPAPPDYSPQAAQVIAQRFAVNFASPGIVDGQDWLTRITPDVTAELADQYRLTDIRNVPDAAVLEVIGPVNADLASPTFQVAYSDGSGMEITLAMGIGGWVVTSVVPHHPASPPQPASPAQPAASAPTGGALR